MKVMRLFYKESWCTVVVSNLQFYMSSVQKYWETLVKKIFKEYCLRFSQCNLTYWIYGTLIRISNINKESKSNCNNKSVVKWQIIYLWDFIRVKFTDFHNFSMGSLSYFQVLSHVKISWYLCSVPQRIWSISMLCSTLQLVNFLGNFHTKI